MIFSCTDEDSVEQQLAEQESIVTASGEEGDQEQVKDRD